MSISCKTRQRSVQKIFDTIDFRNSVCTARVLPEVTLPDIADEIRPKSLKRLQLSSNDDDDAEEVYTRSGIFVDFDSWKTNNIFLFSDLQSTFQYLLHGQHLSSKCTTRKGC